jgi:hypothetical protein
VLKLAIYCVIAKCFPLPVRRAIENGPSGRECMNRTVPLTSASLISPAYKCGHIKTVKFTEGYISLTREGKGKQKSNNSNTLKSKHHNF